MADKRFGALHQLMSLRFDLVNIMEGFEHSKWNDAGCRRPSHAIS